jgi:phosphoribosyl-ATP pyrophosphohydrolase
MNDVLARLSQVLEARKGADPESSYVAKLYAKGLDAILKKLGEEATETVMAAKDGEADKLVHEVADLWFHTLVLLAHQGLGPDRAGPALWPVGHRREGAPHGLRAKPAPPSGLAL